MLLRFFTSTFHTLQTIHQFFYCIVLQTSFCGLERHISLRSWMQFSCFINYHLSSVLQHITFPAPFSFQWYFLLKTLHQSKKHRNQVLQTRHDKKTIVHSVIIHCYFGESSPRSLFEGLPGLFYGDGNHEYTFQYGAKTPADCWRCDYYCIRLIKIWHL